MKNIILVLAFILSNTASAQFEAHAGGYLLNNVKTAGLSVMLYKFPESNVDKWVKRVNPFIGADISGPYGNHIKLGVCFTVYQSSNFLPARLNVSILPAYLNYNLDINRYNTPLGFLIQFYDKPVSFTLLSAWFNDGHTGQVIFAYKFRNNKDIRA